MKNILLFLSIIILLSCDIIEDPISPVNCYCNTTIVNSTSGEVISNKIVYDFIDNPESIGKWENDEGIVVNIDTINHTQTIVMRKCLTIDSKY
jgi:hypothetical protein